MAESDYSCLTQYRPVSISAERHHEEPALFSPARPTKTPAVGIGGFCSLMVECVHMLESESVLIFVYEFSAGICMHVGLTTYIMRQYVSKVSPLFKQKLSL